MGSVFGVIRLFAHKSQQKESLFCRLTSETNEMKGFLHATRCGSYLDSFKVTRRELVLKDLENYSLLSTAIFPAVSL